MIKKADILLYFGSFNPPHLGHTSVARYALEGGFCKELWFVVSPGNPFKSTDMLAPAEDRLRMTEIAVQNELGDLTARVCDVEFSMPRPSYTIDTLRELKHLYPGRSFSLLVGMDILCEIDRWKESQTLLKDYNIFVYPREGFEDCGQAVNFIFLTDAPEWYFSSTDVRNTLASRGDIRRMVSPGVYEYIKENDLWETNCIPAH